MRDNWVRLTPTESWDWSVPVPFSQGWRVGNMVFVGGQISADEQGRVIGEGDITLQTKNVFEAIGRVLEEANASWEDVVKLNTYYVFDGEGDDIRLFWEKMTETRLKYIPNPGPAATAVRVAGLAYPGLLIEADVIAIVNEKD
jgi:enamine deaminase RidA (YjgF/YER057c/UK114 family)